MKSNIQLVCFDLGRVLVGICDGWAHAGEIAGVGAVREMDATDAARMQVAVERHELGQTDLARFAETVAPLMDVSAEQVQAMSRAYLCGAFPGVVELVDELHAAGTRTACLSNTNETHWRLMLTEGGPNHLPLHRFTYQFASHLVGARKPDPAIYAFVERRAELPGESILFFDDAQANVDAAVQRGWRACRIDPAGDPIAQARDALLRHEVIA